VAATAATAGTEVAPRQAAQEKAPSGAFFDGDATPTA
jgi:hypothetical protein